ncbi:YciI family protein [Cyclobacterium sp. 1_MG-2023]|uniref:YciI family protein n=1 Tax=Cyclobacterium sp. 1_MG-2023 TaxID=3062681 RepID=UPI0026E21FEA|nr:YciI family protein [Cyclobacterium sp. 1_MG-2023]MDO6436521.1 YciI family protein [Cyclobacterium sp. 1_MG-2023]
MKEFMMIFRNEKSDQQNPSPEQMQAMINQWQDWIGGIAAQDKFVSTNALGYEGQTVNASGVVSDGPYAEVKEIVGGYIIVKALDLADAVKLSEGCPTLLMGGKVEIRDVMVIN